MTYDVLARARRAQRRRRLRTAVYAVVAVAAIVAAFVVAASSPHDDSGPAQAGRLSTVAPADPAATASAGDADPASSAVLPGDLTFRQIAGASVPVSAQAGPHNMGHGAASGFRRDRAGAVLAAVNLIVQVTPQVGPDVFEATLRSQVAGPNVSALREQVEQQYRQLCASAGVAPGRPVGGFSAVLRGYRIDLYSDTTVVVQVMTEADRPGAGPLYVAAVLQLAWTDGDWALIAPDGGVWDQSITQVAAENVGTYHPFAAGR
jgi:hypothetical protein